MVCCDDFNVAAIVVLSSAVIEKDCEDKRFQEAEFCPGALSVVPYQLFVQCPPCWLILLLEVDMSTQMCSCWNTYVDISTTKDDRAVL